MKEKDINGKYISNAIGYCECPLHPGALNRKLGYKHKCVGKKCKYLVRTNQKAWELQLYRNVQKGVKNNGKC